MTLEPNMKLPILHDACPTCGSKKRIGDTLIQQYKDEGSLHKDSFNDGLVFQIPLVDQAHPPAILGPTIKIKTILVFWDVCECGQIYCTKFDCVEAKGQVQMNQKPGLGKFPGGRIPFSNDPRLS